MSGPQSAAQAVTAREEHIQNELNRIALELDALRSRVLMLFQLPASPPVSVREPLPLVDPRIKDAQPGAIVVEPENPDGIKKERAYMKGHCGKWHGIARDGSSVPDATDLDVSGFVRAGWQYQQSSVATVLIFNAVAMGFASRQPSVRPAARVGNEFFNQPAQAEEGRKPGCTCG